MDWTLKLGDIAVVFATILGPITAVQVQKWLERGRERKQRRIAIFRTLMVTRAASLSPAHVEALNGIPIEFYGRGGKLCKIIDAWKAYLDCLSQKGVAPEVWAQKRFDLFIDLLENISDFLGYDFNRVEISKEVYSPIAHEEIQSEQDIIRRGFAKLFKGEIALPMDVKSFPVNVEAVQEQDELRKYLIRWFEGGSSVKVEVSNDPVPVRK